MGLDREKLIAWLETEATNHREELDRMRHIYGQGFHGGQVRAYNNVIEGIDAGDFDD